MFKLKTSKYTDFSIAFMNLDLRIYPSGFLRFNMTRKIVITCQWFSYISNCSGKYGSEDGWQVYWIEWIWFGFAISLWKGLRLIGNED